MWHQWKREIKVRQVYISHEGDKFTNLSLDWDEILFLLAHPNFSVWFLMVKFCVVYTIYSHIKLLLVLGALNLYKLFLYPLVTISGSWHNHGYINCVCFISFNNAVPIFILFAYSIRLLFISKIKWQISIVNWFTGGPQFDLATVIGRRLEPHYNWPPNQIKLVVKNKMNWQTPTTSNLYIQL
jgi:hypothetical protein